MPSMRQVKRVSAVLIWVDNRVSRFAISVRTSAIPGAHLGHADLELVGGDVLALLDDQPESVREGVRLNGREVGSGQRPGDGVRVEHHPGRGPVVRLSLVRTPAAGRRRGRRPRPSVLRRRPRDSDRADGLAGGAALPGTGRWRSAFVRATLTIVPLL